MIIRLYHAVGIRLNGQEGDGNFDVGVYQSDGERRGLYDTRTETVRRLITALHPGISDVDMRNTENKLRVLVPKVEPCKDKALVPVNNGIFDYENKILLDFDPKYVFTSKSNVDFVPNAQNSVIHNDQDGTDWDVVSWMEELSDDPEVVKVLWQVLGASLRPNMPWNKSVWLYSTQGNNGKGTFCALVRNLLGKGSWASIPLKDFGQDFMLEELTRVQAIITDENDVGTYIDKAATLKSVITGDPFLLNRKYKLPCRAFSAADDSMRERDSEAQGQVGIHVQAIARDSVREAIRGLRAEIHQGRLSGTKGCPRIRFVPHLVRDGFRRVQRSRSIREVAGRVPSRQRPSSPVRGRGVWPSHMGPAPLQVSIRFVPLLVPDERPSGKDAEPELLLFLARTDCTGIRMAVTGQGPLGEPDGCPRDADSRISGTGVDESRLPGKRQDASGAARREGQLSRLCAEQGGVDSGVHGVRRNDRK